MAALRASDTPVGAAAPSLTATPSDEEEAAAAEDGGLLLPPGAPPRAGKSSSLGAACTKPSCNSATATVGYIWRYTCLPLRILDRG